MLRDKIIKIFVKTDDFCKEFENEIQTHLIENKWTVLDWVGLNFISSSMIVARFYHFESRKNIIAKESHH